MIYRIRIVLSFQAKGTVSVAPCAIFTGSAFQTFRWSPIFPPCSELGSLLIASVYFSPSRVNFPCRFDSHSAR